MHAYLIELAARQLTPWLLQRSGECLLQLGDPKLWSLSEPSAIPLKVLMAPMPGEGETPLYTQALPSQLPLAQDSVDLLLALYVGISVPSVNEMHRVLKPGGCLLLIDLLATLGRIRPQLDDLDFEVVAGHFFGFKPYHRPWAEKVGSICFPFWAHSYIVVALKQPMALTPLRIKGGLQQWAPKKLAWCDAKRLNPNRNLY